MFTNSPFARLACKGMVFLALLCGGVHYAWAAEARLNQAGLTHLHAVIDAEIKSEGDRAIVNGWTEAQQVAEFICRPLAKKEVLRQFPSADLVLFDQGAHSEQRMLSPTLLSGKGQYRIGNAWTSFHFQCELSEKTGAAVNFHLIAQ